MQPYPDNRGNDPHRPLEQDASHIPHPTFMWALRFWLKLGFISFGGPAGQIAIMQQELVERRKWLSTERFLNALNYCMLLPGPEAQQLAVYIGWLLHKIPGGIVAGAFFVIPSMFVLFALSYIYVAHGDVSWIASIFSGLKPAVMAVVAAAVIKIGKKAVKNSVMVAIATLSFVSIFFFKIPFPIIVIGAGLAGFAGSLLWPDRFDVIKAKGDEDSEKGYVQICEDPLICHVNPSRKRDASIVMVFVILWVVPIAILHLLSSVSVFFTAGLFFTKAAFLTFWGGLYRAGVHRPGGG